MTYVGVDENGKIKLDELEAAIRPDTILISVMAANNEIGTIEPLKEIGAIAKKHGVLFHTDAVQAFAHVPINVDEMNIDMLSASGHKINGPKGIGVMYIRKGVKRNVSAVPAHTMFRVSSELGKQRNLQWQICKRTRSMK